MENLQGAIRRICIFIMLFVMVLCGNIYAQAIDGKITLKIEHKTLTLQEAQQHISQKTPVVLKVSMIMEGEWVTYIDNQRSIGIGQSSFSYAIASSAGTTRTDAPFDKNTSAWPLAGKAGCTASDGSSIVISDVYPGYPRYYTTPSWNQTGCPTYGYGLGFQNMAISLSDSYYSQYVHKSADGKSYEVDLFPIAFFINSTSTIYVRGVDCAGTISTDPDDPETRDNGASTGTTEINIINIDDGGVKYTMAGVSGDADWTFGPSARYGGIIPGGIFIEQSPEVAQFEPCQQRKTA